MAANTTELTNLLKALDSKDEQVRADAIRQVRGLSPQDLLALAQMEAQHFRQFRRRQYQQATLIVLTIYIPFWIYMWRSHAKPGFVIMLGIYMPIMMYVILPMMRLRMDGYQPSRARRSLTAVLESVNDVSFVPVALTLLQDKTKEIIPALTDVLKRLLPQLRVGDAQNWTQEQYQALLKLLPTPPKDNTLALSVLKALKQIGDVRALPAVQSLADGAAWMVTPEIRQAARECLPYLQHRAGEQIQAQTLLRATTPCASSETLLRAATQTTSRTPDEQLLRSQQNSITDLK